MSDPKPLVLDVDGTLLLQIADMAKEQDVEVVLASASDVTLVEQIAQDQNLSPRVFASDGAVNLKGAAKADALVAAYGPRGFHYAGNDRSDLEIWRRADEAIIVGRVPGAKALLNRDAGNPRVFGGGFLHLYYQRPARP